MLVTSQTTSMLLSALRDPDQEAVWREFDARYRPILASLARRVGLDEETAADVAQDALSRFARAYRDGRYDRSKGRLRSWLIGIAKHCMADAITARSARREQRGESALIHIPDEAQLTAEWARERESVILHRALEELRETSRFSENAMVAFTCVVFGGEAPGTVAERLGMTRHDVYVAKHRITERLRGIVARLERVYDDEE